MTIRIIRTASLGLPVGTFRTLAPATEAALVADKEAVYDGPQAGLAGPVTADESGNLFANGQKIQGSVSGAGKVPDRIFPAARTLISFFGHSQMEVGAINNGAGQDMRMATATSTPVALSTEKPAAWLEFYSNGQLQTVFNGGIGGQNSTQIAARAIAASNLGVITTKSLVDAKTLGAVLTLVCTGVNDLIALTTASTPAQIETAISTALGNAQITQNQCFSYGLLPFLLLEFPFGSTPVTANQAVVNAAVVSYNARVKALWWSQSATFDPRPYVVGADGGWDPSLCDVNVTHPNRAAWTNGLGKDLTAAVLLAAGVGKAKFAFPDGPNLFANADLRASSGGLATGVTVAQADGTATPSIVVANGVNCQQFIWTPGNANGVGSNLIFDITASGATAINDVAAVEFDLLVDDGAGGAPAVYGISAYLRKPAAGQPTIFNTAIGTPGGVTTLPFKAAVVGKVAGGLVKLDEASSALYARVSINSIVNPSSIRVQVSNIRIVKVPTTF